MEIAKLCNNLIMDAFKESSMKRLGEKQVPKLPSLPAGYCLRCSAAEREKNFILACAAECCALKILKHN